MNIEQERAEFEVWANTQADKWLIVGGLTWNPVTNDYASARTSAAWAAWQARAALQSQDIEDTERLDWLESNHGCDITEFSDGTWEVDVPDGPPYGVGKGMRDAIDHARRIEGDT